MTLKGGTTQACASCKYQRRKCTSECLLAPYFPADQPKIFQNVHKLFGVSNIVKLLKALDPSQRKTAMDSIIFQANIRDRYPVHGCWEEICRLRYQIWQVEEELHYVRQQLQIYRQHQASSMPADHVASQLELGMPPAPRPAGVPLFINQNSYNNVSSLQHSYSNSSSNVAPYNSLYVDSKDIINAATTNNPWWDQNLYADNNFDSMAMHPHEFVASQTTDLDIQRQVVQDYDEMHPFFDAIDDRQSYIYSKEAYESSSEESQKDTRKCIEHVAENELKSAAACFSLTSVN